MIMLVEPKRKSLLYSVIAVILNLHLITQIKSKIKSTKLTASSEQFKDLIKNAQTELVLEFDSSKSIKYKACLEIFTQLQKNLAGKLIFKTIDVSPSYLPLWRNSLVLEHKKLARDCQWKLKIGDFSIEFPLMEYNQFDIEKWIRKRLNRHPHRIKSEEHFYNISNEYFTIVYIFNDTKKDPKRKTKETNIRLNLKLISMEFPYTYVYYSFSQKVNKNLQLGSGHWLILLRKFEDGHKTFHQPETISVNDMGKFIRKHRFPQVMWWNKHVHDFILQEHLNIAVLVLNKGKNFHLEAAYERIARLFPNSIVKFGIVSINNNNVSASQKELLDLLGVKPSSELPVMFGINFVNQSDQMQISRCENTSEEGIKNFLGSLNNIKSQSHCHRNQFLVSHRRSHCVTAINYDSLERFFKIKIPLLKLVLIAKSSDSKQQSVISDFKSSCSRIKKNNKGLRTFLYDRAFNAWPGFLKINETIEQPTLVLFLKFKDGEMEFKSLKLTNKFSLEDSVQKLLQISKNLSLKRIQLN